MFYLYNFWEVLRLASTHCAPEDEVSHQREEPTPQNHLVVGERLSQGLMLIPGKTGPEIYAPMNHPARARILSQQ
jgi:hypothetical protein